MARPRILRSVKWLTPEGDPLPKGPFYLEPVLTPLWEPALLYERRVREFFERRENAFAHVADASRKREARPDRSTAQIARERERDKARKQIERDNYTQEQKESEVARLAQYIRKLKPFIGIDGEGAGEDAFGRQNYVYMAASNAQVDGNKFERELCRDGDALLTNAYLEFIVNLPANATIVGFFFLL